MRSVVCIFLAVFLPGCQTTNRPGDQARLSGTVHFERYYGPPNYGENPEGDRVEEATILRLDHPIRFCKAGGTPFSTAEVQIAGFGNMVEGQHVTCTGNLDEAMTGHHRRDVLLFGF